MSTQLQEGWEEFNVMVELVGKDVEKNVKGNVSAGVRVRKGLRNVRKVLNALIKDSLEHDKAVREQREASRKP